jgi:hypothetical protein
MTIKRVVDFALYICLALAFGCLCIVFAEHDIDSKWLAPYFRDLLGFRLGDRSTEAVLESSDVLDRLSDRLRDPSRDFHRGRATRS